MFTTFPLVNNDLLYTFVELQRTLLTPFRLLAKLGIDFHRHDLNPVTHTKVGRSVAASYELFERMTRHYRKQEFDITHSIVKGKKVAVKEEVVLAKSFCNLLHFKKKGNLRQKKILIVAPMSGHFATLLRGTVEGLLPHFDVYITDWINASDVPVTKGNFHLDDFIDYVIEFIKKIGGKNLSVMAVCQPSVPVLAAVSIMSSEQDNDLPEAMVLMGGPVDARHSPTEVNDFAAEKTIHWFERHVITAVPANYKGFMRKVYPGFIQLNGFMAMNMYRHVGEHIKLFKHLVEGDGESAAAHKKFYNEYLSVMDLPAEFYLDTVTAVFKDFLLPRGKLVSRGRKVTPSAIKNTALLTIEGEKDDISGRNQTKAAHRLCSAIPENKKKHHLQKGVGHYGIFNGRNYREHIVPLIVDFITKSAKK